MIRPSSQPTHRQLAAMAGFLIITTLFACQKDEPGISPETQRQLNAILASLREIEGSVNRIESQYQAVRQEQQTAANSLDTLRIQAETVDGDLAALESASAASRLEIEKLKQKVGVLKNELALVASGEAPPAPQTPPVENQTLQIFLAIVGGILLVAAIIASLFYMRIRQKRTRSPMASRNSPPAETAIPEEPPTEAHTELGAIRFYGVAKTEHEKQTYMGTSEKSPESPGEP